MNESPFVSIVIPTRNRALHLERCLETLILQDYPSERFEIVIADDRSTDQTALRVEAIINQTDNPLIRYLRCNHVGANAARNAAIAQSSGDLLCFVDDDILAPPQWLSYIVSAVVRCEVEVVWGPVLLPSDLRLPGRHRWEVAPYLSEASTPQVPLLCNMAVKTIVFIRGLFDARWSSPVEEIEWLLRTNPSKAFAAAAWLWHDKGNEDCTVSRLLKLAWSRGIESGRFDRFRMGGGTRPLIHAAIGALRATGHAVRSLCMGGLFVAAGRTGYLLGYGLTPRARSAD